MSEKYYSSKSAKPAKSYLKGYTIIELVTVIMIMVLVFGLGIVRYRDFQRRQSLDAAARTLTTDLRFAQEKAMAGNKPAGFCDALSLDSYIVRRISNNSYRVVAKCMPGSVEVVVKDVSEIAFSTKHPGITITFVPQDIVFRVLGEGVEENVLITLILTNTTLIKTVTVTTGGEIK